MNLSDEIIRWYQLNQRDLPWRNTTDPYVIWLSEVILQQTRVEQGLPYFHRFIKRYPSLADLAAACEDEVLKLWQGLGYYSRGRNMLQTAKVIQSEFGGQFPVHYADLIQLKGIGDYTAAAIASFSRNEPKAVVDGNVYRVLARYFGIEDPIDTSQGKKKFQNLATQLLNKANAGLHNQAIMEFGAIQCKPHHPNCGACFLHTSCYAYCNNLVDKLPVKSKKNAIRERFFNYIIIRNDQEIILNKRSTDDIWANMYDFPLIETSHFEKVPTFLLSDDFKNLFKNDCTLQHVFPEVKHRLTHQQLFVRFIQIHIGTRDAPLLNNWVIADRKFLETAAMPKVIAGFLSEFLHLLNRH